MAAPLETKGKRPSGFFRGLGNVMNLPGVLPPLGELPGSQNPQSDALRLQGDFLKVAQDFARVFPFPK